MPDASFNELYAQGMGLLREGKDDEAMAVFYEAAKTSPDGWLALGTELLKEKHYAVALERFKEVLALSKNCRIRCAALNNIGMIYASVGENAKADAAFREAARESSEFPDTYSNLAILQKWAGNLPEAIRYASMALKIDPWHEQASFIRAMARLLDGDYIRGFQEYECRWRSRGNGLAKIVTPFPEWDGSNGKRILVYGEQGHGDSILFMRYAREIRKHGLWQSWVAQKALAPILRTIPEIDHVLEVGQRVPDIDCHIPSASLPRILGTTIETIPPAPYLQRPDAQPMGPGFHVGISWRGSKAQTNDLFRSTSLSDWAPVLAVDGVTFHSLQVDGSEEGLLYPQIVQHDKPTDFLQTAQFIAGLDLVISVDTAIVHLCGAMGVPCWVAMHCRPYFVYPPKFGDKSPWYDSIKLYRQAKEMEWKPTFERIANDLASRRMLQP